VFYPFFNIEGCPKIIFKTLLRHQKPVGQNSSESVKTFGSEKRVFSFNLHGEPLFSVKKINLKSLENFTAPIKG